MMAQGWVTPGTRRTGLDIILNFPGVHFIMVLLEIVYHVPTMTHIYTIYQRCH